MTPCLRLRNAFQLLVLAVSFGLVGSPALAAPPETGDVSEKIYQCVLKSAVWVISPRTENTAATGTGSLVDVPRKLVLTNYHVVGDKDKILVIFPNYKRNKSGKLELVSERDYYKTMIEQGNGIRGKVVARDQPHDLALVQLEAVPEGAQPIRLARDSVRTAQRVHSVGNPGSSGALWVYTSGTVRAVYHKKWRAKAGEEILEFDSQIVETQSPTNQGDSGGPLVNDHGELVGVTQGGAANAQLLSTFIEVTEVRDLLKSKGVKVPVGPSTVTTAKPQPAGEPSAKPQPEEGQGAQAERDATRKLKLAKMLADDGLVDKAKLRYNEIIATFPKTKAADEARQYLEKLKR
jgi:S1-C subfamily serine protease